jgi:cell division protein FtsW (lipid II flippase)
MSQNIDFGFNGADLKRIAWSFLFGFVGYLGLNALAIFESPDFGTAVAALFAGAVMAGLSAVKNGVLSDESRLK